MKINYLITIAKFKYNGNTFDKECQGRYTFDSLEKIQKQFPCFEKQNELEVILDSDENKFNFISATLGITLEKATNPQINQEDILKGIKKKKEEEIIANEKRLKELGEFDFNLVD